MREVARVGVKYFLRGSFATALFSIRHCAGLRRLWLHEHARDRFGGCLEHWWGLDLTLIWLA